MNDSLNDWPVVILILIGCAPSCHYNQAQPHSSHNHHHSNIVELDLKGQSNEIFDLQVFS